MTLQDNNLSRQEAAREAFNEYIQYLYIFEEAEREKSDENTADNSSGSIRPTMPLTGAEKPLKSFLPRKA